MHCQYYFRYRGLNTFDIEGARCTFEYGCGIEGIDAIEEHKGNTASDDSTLKSEYSNPVEKIFSGVVRKVIRFGWSLVYSKLLSFYSNFGKKYKGPAAIAGALVMEL